MADKVKLTPPMTDSKSKVTFFEASGWVSVTLMLAGLFGNILGWIPLHIAGPMIAPAFAWMAWDKFRTKRHDR
jgi:hypothetical protein